MADYQLMAFSLFFEGRKLGTFTKGKLSLKGNDEANYGDLAGIVVWSDGVIESSFTASAFQPVQALDYDISAAFLAKTNINLTFGPIGPNLWEISMRVLSVEYDTDVKSGMLNGDFSFGGASKPQRV